MANDAITLNGGAGTQTATGSPQSGAGANNIGNQTRSNLQPNAASGLQGGQQVGGSSLSNISLSNPIDTSSSTSKTTAPATVPLPTHHQVNPMLLVVPVILLLLAAASVWFVRQGAKSTTDYS